MPLIHTNANRVFEKFEKHMSDVVCGVLPLPPGFHLKLKWNNDSGTLEFLRGNYPAPVPVETRLGKLFLALNQDLTATRENLQYRLRTQRYKYQLLPSDDPRAEAIFRWEFKADMAPDVECRNRLHINASLPVGHGTLEFKRTHIPTAYVLIEHVLRFLIHDLEVAPVTPDWPGLLRESETTFYEKFSGKRYRFRG